MATIAAPLSPFTHLSGVAEHFVGRPCFDRLRARCSAAHDEGFPKPRPKDSEAELRQLLARWSNSGQLFTIPQSIAMTGLEAELAKPRPDPIVIERLLDELGIPR